MFNQSNVYNLVRNSIVEKHKDDVNTAMRLYIAPPVIQKVRHKIILVLVSVTFE